MEDNKNSYIQINENLIINERCIIWVRKMGNCLEICTKPNGCYGITHKVCKLENPLGYTKLNDKFIC